MQLAATAALVTGAASGLGAATAAALAAQGAQVTGIDLATAVEGAQPVDGVTLRAADVTSDEEVRAVVQAVREGSAPLRTVVNCAGIVRGARILGKGGVHDLEVFRTVVTVNLIGSFNVMRLTAEAIAATEPDAEGQRGVIVNTASVAAFEGQIGQIAYSASKGGVVGMTLPIARELASHLIRVMTVAPGLFQTPMLAGLPQEAQDSLGAQVPHPSRLGRPAEFAALVRHIVENPMLNGEVIRLDGALRMPPR